MSEVKQECKDKGGFGRYLYVGIATAALAAWNYVVVPIAGTHGLVLPPMPLEKVVSFIMTGGLL
ncbi:hypothetical protein PKO111_113 [Klebsiella phage PKO111]|jgi:hypothetical protein|uniref:Uncharacterized protein n=1 Tax=Klebsiella phage PKO111 TaxID=1654928 RepID=A0A159B7W2_9CAUD|nr:hypothetical protein BI014_gp113 [Klebsiella phage PKO111]AKJ73171.1 hypothetical protein PKO111_113 [Klebsiella phage PKO111]